MRHILNLLTEASSNDAEQIFFKLADYIIHLLEVDFYEVKKALSAIGYTEATVGGTFYRALFIEPTEQDMGHESIADFIENKAISYFRQDNGPQSFATTLKGAVRFVTTTYWDHLGASPPDPDGAIPNLPFAIIYTVEAPADAVMFTTQGLYEFVKKAPESAGARALLEAIEQYQSEDEAIIEVSKTHVIGAQPYVPL